jgi:hypothetical protein
MQRSALFALAFSTLLREPCKDTGKQDKPDFCADLREEDKCATDAEAHLCVMTCDACKYPTASASMWPRLVGDVTRSELKVLRLKRRIDKLNERIDKVINRTSTTQPLVLSFKDNAVTTGTKAAENNFTISGTKPNLEASVPVLEKGNETIIVDETNMTRDEVALGQMNNIPEMQENLTTYEIELGNLVPVLNDYNKAVVPVETFMKQSEENMVRRSVDNALTDFLGDTMAAMATKLDRSQDRLTPGQQ